jgi:hypothetical protein
MQRLFQPQTVVREHVICVLCSSSSVCLSLCLSVSLSLVLEVPVCTDAFI